MVEAKETTTREEAKIAVQLTDEDVFSSEYTDSITSTNSQKPLIKPVLTKGSPNPEHKTIHNDFLLWELKEEDEDMEKRSVISGLLEKPVFMKAVSCESLKSSVVSQACRSAIKLSAESGINTLGSISKVEISEIGSNEKKHFNRLYSYVAYNLSQLKNVIILSLGTMIAYSAFLSVRNLQSSLNSKAGLGLISLAVGYSMYIPGSVLAPFIVRIFRPKRSIVLALSFQSVYIIMNFYPSFYTLIPSSMLVGFGSILFWVSVSTYLVFSAKESADTTKKRFDFVLSSFYGTFFLIYQLNNVPGNILSSVILYSGVAHLPSNTTYILLNLTNFNETTNLTHSLEQQIDPLNCGSSYIHSHDPNDPSPVDDRLRYILIGVLGTINILGVSSILLFVTSMKTYKANGEFKLIILEARKFAAVYRDRWYQLIMPILVYSGLQSAFMNGDMIKAFITCPHGIERVGYILIGYGLSNSLCSYTSGFLNQYIGRQIQIITGYLINVGLLIIMVTWRPYTVESVVPSVALFCLWGIADGIWNSQLNGLIGVVFSERAESANACFRQLQGVGVTVAYGYAQFLSMTTKVYITASVATIGILGYCLMECRFKKAKKIELMKDEESVLA